MNETISVMPAVEIYDVRQMSIPALSIVVPTYNESKNIHTLIEKIGKSLNHVDYEVIIVDDNSPDGTSEIVRELNEQYENLKLVERSGKLGLSSAVLDGFATANESAQVLSVMDADLQHPPDLLAKMYSEISDGCDLVIASRYLHESRIQGWSVKRRIVSRIATALVKVIFKETRGVSDVLSGFFMVKRKVVVNTPLSPVGFKILLELLVNGECLLVSEIPYTFSSRKNGKSNLNTKEIWTFLVHIRKLLKARSTAKYVNRIRFTK